MSLFNLFKKTEKAVDSNDAFWIWFQKNEQTFFQVVKEQKNIEKLFFDQLSLKLNSLKKGYFYLTGMYDKNTVELVITADGDIKNIPFVEQLIDAAPTIIGWKFTALKPALSIENVNINMAGFKFNQEKICFYANVDKAFPDQIDLTIVYESFEEKNRSVISNGVYIFLDNYLGELNFATTIDNIKVVSREQAEKELIPIERLKAFLNWREKEFIEKYEGIRQHTDDDSYSMLEAKLENGNALLAVINRDLLDWDKKASHPWVMVVEISYDGSNNKGMPDNDTYELLNIIENNIVNELRDIDGYLNIGRQTAEGSREIYFACKDFRKPALLMFEIEKIYSKQIKIEYDIYKDKYWKSFNQFVSNG